MSAPFKTPAKVPLKAGSVVPVGPQAVAMIKKDSADFQKKLFGESCKKLIEGFVAGHIDYSMLLSNFGMYAESYCKAVGRESETLLIEFSDASDSSNSDTDEDENEDFIDSVHSQPRWED